MRGHAFRSLRIVVVASLLWGCVIPYCYAQAAARYIEDKPSDRLRTNPNEEARWKGTARKVLKGELALADSRSAFENYFNFYRFPIMTLNDPESLKQLTSLRMRFFQEFMEAASDPVAHEELAQLTLKYMLKVADGNYHPAVRYNAMLMIVDLNVTEVVRSGLGSGRASADPHPSALQPMLDRFQAKDSLDLIRLAALLGIVRHVEMDNYRPAGNRMKPELRKAVLDTLVKLVQQKDPPSYRNQEGHEWMRRKGVEGLGYAMLTQADPALLTVLDNVMQDETDKLSVRCTAATALGRAHWANGAKYNVAQGVTILGQLVANILSAESARLVAQSEHEASLVGPVGANSSTSSGLRGGYSEGPPVRLAGDDPYGLGGLATTQSNDPLAYRVVASRRQLRAWLHSVEQALQGVDDRAEPKNKNVPTEPRGLIVLATAPAAKTAVENLQAEVKKVALFLEEDTNGLGTADYETKLKGMAQLVTASLIPAAAPPAAAPPMAVPGAAPVLAPGEVPGEIPGAIPAVPGEVPGEIPAAPGEVPGAVAPAAPAPAAAPGEIPGELPLVP